LGFTAYVTDPRTIGRIDIDTMVMSFLMSNGCFIMDDCNRFARISSVIAFMFQVGALDGLFAPLKRITAKHVPPPYAKNLIEYYMPSAKDAYEACKQVMYTD
jgi:pyruvate dehydrogenase E1 component beta subunit